MFSDEIFFYAVLGFGALGVGTIIYIILDPLLSGTHKAEKRKNTVAAGPKAKFEAREGVIEQTRRMQVQDALKELEEKSKKKKKVSMRLRLQRAGLENLEPRTYYIFSFLLGLILGAVVFLVGVPIYGVALAVFVGGVGVPRFILAKLTQQRQAKFLKVFVTAIDIIVRGVKAGLPFNDCMMIITNEVAEPVKSEFSQLVEQQKVGVPVEQALQKLFERVPLQEVNFFTIVVAIQLQVGGNISEALANLAKVLRDRHKLHAKVKAVSQEAKASAAIIGALPLLVMAGVGAANPKYMEILFTDPTGHLILGGSAIVMLTGVLVMRWMINIKV